jgi:uncharacterized delta-60 repeat protein
MNFMFPSTFLNTAHRPTLITPFSFVALFMLLFYPLLPAAAAPGELDPTFAGSGISPSLASAQNYSGRMVVQPDGKIVGGGYVIEGSFPGWKFKLARFYPNGLVDTSFGTNGVVITQLTGYQNTFISFGDIDLLPDGKIVLVGSAQVPNPNNPFINRTDLFVVRYNPNGSLDTSFYGTGIFSARVGGLETTGESITVQPDGKFMVVGHCGGTVKGIPPPYKILLYRFAGNSLDPTFGDGSGRVLTEIQNADLYTYRIAVRPDGKILVSGRARFGTAYGFILARYEANGTIDTSFDTDGILFLNDQSLYGTPASLIIQPDGKILSVGSRNYQSNGSDFLLLRFNDDGTPDASFGTNGRVVTVITNIKDTATGAALQPDGKIVVSGITSNHSTGGSDSTPRSNGLLVRYNPDGSLDANFGTGGIVKTPSNYFLSDVSILPSGKILALKSDYSVLRFLGDAPLVVNPTNFDFDGDGWADFAVTRNVGGSLNWYAVENPSSLDLVDTEFGLATDKIVPADYDGDKKTDVAVFRPSSGDWYILKSSTGAVSTVHFGQNGDVPVPADYDGDARADLAVYRQGDWYILNSADNSFRAEQFGIATDKPLRADFDGDGRADLAVYRNGIWYAQRSGAGFFAASFGVADDIPVPADYDGDRLTDLAVYRAANGTWYLQNSAQGFQAFQFGAPGDKPVPADYDADGKTDIAVFRNGNWYLQQSASGFRAVQFGASGDTPAPTAFQP